VKRNSYDERLVRDMLTTEIDVVNIKTILRMVRDKIEPSDAMKYLLAGGKRIQMKKLMVMLNAKTLEETVGMLNGTPYSFLTEVPEEYYRGEKVSEFEKRLDRYLIGNGLNAFNGDPLSIAIAVGYYWAKYNEITNIRIIARCKTADILDETVKGELFYV